MNSVFAWAVFGYYLVFNLALLALMGLDKLKAVKDWRRIPEKNLLYFGWFLCWLFWVIYCFGCF